MYYSLTDAQFWFFGLISFLSVLIGWYLPGWLIISKIKLSSKITETALSIVMGMVLWGYQAVLLGYIQLRFATYIYLILTLILSWKNKKQIFVSLHQSWKEMKEIPKIILFGVAISVILQLYAHVGSGFLAADGVAFYFVNSVDGVMHLSYIQSMAEKFPPMEPGFAGRALENYHYWGDLVLAELHRLWNIPVINLFFHYIPIVLILLTTVLVIQLIRMLKGGTTTMLVALFLLSCGADAAFVVAQYLNHNWGGEIASLDTGVSFIFNMPQVFSRLILVAVLTLLVQWIKTKQLLSILLLSILGASLFGFKVYYGLYFVAGMGFLTGFLLIRHILKKYKIHKQLFTSFYSFFSEYSGFLASLLVLVTLSAAIFLPTNSNSGGLFFEPLAWTKKLLSADNFNYQDWFLRMQVYEATNNMKSIIFYNLLGVVITVMSIYGVRFIGMLPIKRAKHHFSWELLSFVIPANVLFIFIGFLFLQTTGGFNIYNFLITPILTMNIIAAFNISSIKRTIGQIVMISIFVLLSLPRTLLQLHGYAQTYAQQNADYVISNYELELLTHLRTLPQGVVQADLENTYENSTPYVSFFSNQPTYLGGKYLLKMDTQFIAEREQALVALFNSQSPGELAHEMENLNIRYLYITTPEVVKKFVNLSVNSSSVIIQKQNQAGIIISTN